MNKINKILCFLLVFAQIFCVSQPVTAATVSAKNKEKFKNIIWNQTYKNDSSTKMLSDASYMLKDLNKDGKKELFVTGLNGVQFYGNTIVYSDYKGKLVKTCVDGRLSKISTKGFCTNDEISEGSVHSASIDYIYTVGSNGKAKLVASKVYDKWTTDYIGSMPSKYEETTIYYSGSNKKITKSQYNTIYKKYKFKNATTYSCSAHKKLLSLLGTTKTPKLAGGNYYVCPTSDEELIDAENWDYGDGGPDAWKVEIKGNYIYIYGEIWTYDLKIKKSGNIYKLKLDSNYKIYYSGGDYYYQSTDIKTFNRDANSSYSYHLGTIDLTVKNNKVTEITCGEF